MANAIREIVDLELKALKVLMQVDKLTCDPSCDPCSKDDSSHYWSILKEHREVLVRGKLEAELASKVELVRKIGAVRVHEAQVGVSDREVADEVRESILADLNLIKTSLKAGVDPVARLYQHREK